MTRGTATVVQCRDISTVYHSLEVFQSWCTSLRVGQLGPSHWALVSDGVPSILYNILFWSIVANHLLKREDP